MVEFHSDQIVGMRLPYQRTFIYADGHCSVGAPACQDCAHRSGSAEVDVR